MRAIRKDQLPDAWFSDLRRQASDHGVAITSVFTAHRELGGFFRDDGPGWEAVGRRNFERLIDVAAFRDLLLAEAATVPVDALFRRRSARLMATDFDPGPGGCSALRPRGNIYPYRRACGMGIKPRTGMVYAHGPGFDSGWDKLCLELAPGEWARYSLDGVEGELSVELAGEATEPASLFVSLDDGRRVGEVAVEGPFSGLSAGSLPARGAATVRFGYLLNPNQGGVPGLEVKTVVKNASGKAVVEGSFKTTSETPTYFTVALPADAPAGDYALVATFVTAKGRKEVSAKFKIVPVRPKQFFVDQDGTLLVDGKPFFPLGIYHLYPDAYPEVAEIGFNTVQTFQWMTRNRESLDAAQALGLKVIFENNEKELGGHNYLPEFIGKHPALLMWYAPDEPLHEGNNKFASDVSDIYRQGDPSHPIICVDFNPPRYALNARCSDVFGTELYIFNKDGETPFWKAVDLMDVAHDAVQQRKPIFGVPRATGGERVEDERVVTWIALTHDARGLFWYAWDEGNDLGLGLKYDTSLQEGLKGIILQIRELIPALTAPVRRPFVEEKVHGMVCDDGETRTLLVINMAQEQKAVPTIPEFQGLSPEPVFGEPAITVPLAPLESRAYRCRVDKRSAPGADRLPSRRVGRI